MTTELSQEFVVHPHPIGMYWSFVEPKTGLAFYCPSMSPDAIWEGGYCALWSEAGQDPGVVARSILTHFDHLMDAVGRGLPAAFTRHLGLRIADELMKTGEIPEVHGMWMHAFAPELAAVFLNKLKAPQNLRAAISKLYKAMDHRPWSFVDTDQGIVVVHAQFLGSRVGSRSVKDYHLTTNAFLYSIVASYEVELRQDSHVATLVDYDTEVLASFRALPYLRSYNNYFRVVQLSHRSGASPAS